MEKFYKVKIGTPNKFFIYKGRPVRSPVELKVTEKELKIIKMKIITDGISDYSINEISDEKIITDIPSVIGKEIIVEKVIKENEVSPKSILDKLLIEEDSEI